MSSTRALVPPGYHLGTSTIRELRANHREEIKSKMQPQLGKHKQTSGGVENGKENGGQAPGSRRTGRKETGAGKSRERVKIKGELGPPRGLLEESEEPWKGSLSLGRLFGGPSTRWSAMLGVLPSVVPRRRSSRCSAGWARWLAYRRLGRRCAAAPIIGGRPLLRCSPAMAPVARGPSAVGHPRGRARCTG